jgi:rRNA maturation RNase YbeY
MPTPKKDSGDAFFSIHKTTRGKLPKLPFAAIKKAVIGPHYCLSLVFIGQTRSRTLNRRYRGKDAPANVLSFSLNKTNGEIFITLDKAKKEARHFNKTFSQFIGYLFIHGLLHLKGSRHGSKMESAEKRFMELFNLE